MTINDLDLAGQIHDLKKAAGSLDELVRDGKRLELLEALEVLHYRASDAIRRLWAIKR